MKDRMQNPIQAPFVLVAAAAACAFSAAPASAALVNFTVGGTFVNGSVLSGGLTIDNVAGSVTAADVSVSGVNNYHFVSPSVALRPGHTTVFIDEIAAANVYLSLVLPVTTLVGFTGSYIASTSRPAPDGVATAINIPGSPSPFLAVGAVAVAPTPSAAMGGTALLGAVSLFGAARRRRAGATAAS